jgi:hypothetical protein
VSDLRYESGLKARSGLKHARLEEERAKADASLRFGAELSRERLKG